MEISVIIPLYNMGSFIRGCLDSLIAQELQPAEIICVDDCSSDEGPSIVEEFVSRFPSLVTLVRFTENSGAPAARNTGIKLAKGEYIQFLDADDFLLPGKLAHQVHVLHSLSEKPGFIAAAFTRRSEENSDKKIGVSEKDKWLSLLEGKLGCTCSNLWKKEDILRIDGFRTGQKSSQEFALMLDLLKSGSSVVFDHESFTIVRSNISGKSISYKTPGENWKRFIALRGETIEYLKAANLLHEKNMTLYYQPVFEAIRIFYNYSPVEAVKLYREYIPGSFRPVPSRAVTSGYCRIYSLLGFSATEKLRSLFRPSAKHNN